MSKHHLIRSQPFDAPFVRVRGRLSRQGVVTWSPCLRTFHPPNWIKSAHEGEQPHEFSGPPGDVATAADVEQLAGVPNPHYRNIVAAQTNVPPEDVLVPHGTGGGEAISVSGHNDGYVITFEDATGKPLARAPVHIRFFAPDRRRALFTQRLPYHRDTYRVVLSRDRRELGALIVPARPPEFVLAHPTQSDEIDVSGVLHLRWGLYGEEQEEYAKKYPLTYYVRYSGDGRRWYRPGVNIKDTSFDLDLREMPGGEHCVAQVIATNGYQTSYVETPACAVPRKPPEILLATPRGPLLFAQGFSREDGPLVGESIEWLVDGKRPAGTGASFNVRSLGRHIRQLSVRVTDSLGVVTLQHLGWYDGETGRQVTPRAGY